MGSSRRPGTGLRVVAGRFRGLRLETREGLEVRPTADRVREALFSILMPRLEGARVVDCFAGSGALGIEALSRGAARVAFVERDRRSLEVLRRNLGRLPDADGAVVVAADALRPEAWAGAATRTAGEAISEAGALMPADLVLADPPYRQGLVPELLEALARARVVPGDGLVVAEHEAQDEPVHPSWEVLRRRRYGDTVLSFFRPAGGEPRGDLDENGDLPGDL